MRTLADLRRGRSSRLRATNRAGRAYSTPLKHVADDLPGTGPTVDIQTPHRGLHADSLARVNPPDACFAPRRNFLLAQRWRRELRRRSGGMCHAQTRRWIGVEQAFAGTAEIVDADVYEVVLFGAGLRNTDQSWSVDDQFTWTP